MSKKSAKSKGYRKQTKAKAYLSKKDIIILCVIVVIIAIIAIALALYDDGALKVKDGVAVTEGDNWLIVDGSASRSKPRYFKLGEIGDVDGYRRETVSSTYDTNVKEYYFYPEDEGDPIDYITIGASHATSKLLTETVINTLGGLTGYETTDIMNSEINGISYLYYSYTVDSEAAGENDADADADPSSDAADAPDEEDSVSPRYIQSINAYIDGAQDSCIIVHVVNNADSLDEYLSDEALKAVLDQAVSAVSVEAAR